MVKCCLSKGDDGRETFIYLGSDDIVVAASTNRPGKLQNEDRFLYNASSSGAIVMVVTDGICSNPSPARKRGFVLEDVRM